ncbi:MAG: carboxymuconolactone decarboxylase family protein [Kiloniellaceae bacterium]
MSIFSIHTAETAPEKSRATLETGKKRYGFVPNLWGALAEAPAALEGYVALAGFFEKASLSRAERQVVLLAASAANKCTYCVAAHSTIAGMQDVPEEVIAALRDGTPIADPRLQALRRFAETLVEKRGWASEEDVQAFLSAGFTRQQVFEVILGLTYKTLSNYTNHLVGTPLDEAFAARAWNVRKAG